MPLPGVKGGQTAKVGFFVDSASAEGQKEVRLEPYSFSTEEGVGQTVIDQNNAELVLEGNLFLFAH